jgi:hypothetical protein
MKWHPMPVVGHGVFILNRVFANFAPIEVQK